MNSTYQKNITASKILRATLYPFEKHIFTIPLYQNSLIDNHIKIVKISFTIYAGTLVLYNEDKNILSKMKLLPPSHLQETLVLRAGREEFVKNHVHPDSPHVTFTIGRYISRKRKKLFPDFAAAKQWMNETFHGLGPLHLQAYFNEFCYRLNQKRKNSSIFGNLSHLCMSNRRTTYAALTYR